MVEQGGAQVSPTELELKEEGRVSAVVNHLRQREWKERVSVVCGVWCGGKCGFVLSRTVLGCLFTHWLRITISG